MKIRIIFHLMALLYVIMCQTLQLKAAQRSLALNTPDNNSKLQDNEDEAILRKVIKVPFRSHDTILADLSDVNVICLIFCLVTSMSLCTLGYHCIRIVNVLSRLNAKYKVVPKTYLQAIRNIFDSPYEDYFVLDEDQTDISDEDYEIALRMHLEAVENLRW
ncbi:uncharacterized protein LOC131879984 [Tigriopus californicus]|uniref:uncharacterized protein LOC131879984 n=1 Tax=Tigriopus californicus TaxID=6832 RepID=UPI0027DA4D26|nr:uncharacterized protein LOC131879984 [Tigriopus californicus]